MKTIAVKDEKALVAAGKVKAEDLPTVVQSPKSDERTPEERVADALSRLTLLVSKLIVAIEAQETGDPRTALAINKLAKTVGDIKFPESRPIELARMIRVHGIERTPDGRLVSFLIERVE